MLAPFCGGARAVLLAQSKSWVDASTRSEFFKIVAAAARRSGHEPREWSTRLQRSGLRERRSWGGVTGVSTRESRCLRWKRPRERAARVGLPDVGEARRGSLETEVDKRCHN